MDVRPCILATAGHVDHGKSALVKALTGTDPDRLPEERARGITIDLGFAHLQLAAQPPSAEAVHGATPAPTPAVFDIGLIDVPGHEDFVKNMVAGVGSIDLALLVVAADDGWMPQSEEHLQILQYLGVSRAVVALTKTDLISDPDPVSRELRAHLQDSSIADAPIVPTSVITGQGLDALRAALITACHRLPPPADLGRPRLSVDRLFVLQGVGTVVTGTLIGGPLIRGQTVVVQPGGFQTRIRSLQSHNQDLDQASPGSRVALNLPDAEPGINIRRGSVITLADLGAPSFTLDVSLHRSARLHPLGGRHARPLPDNARVRVHIGTANVPARVALWTSSPLVPGSTTLAQLRLEQPLFACSGDHFILRDAAEQTTLAGGMVLDAESDRRGFRTAARAAFLQPRRDHPDDPIRHLHPLLLRDAIVPIAGLMRRSRFPTPAVGRALETLVDQRLATVRGALAVEANWWSRSLALAAAAIDAHHREHPEQPGLPLAALHQQLAFSARPAGLLDHLVHDLGAAGYAQHGIVVRRNDHHPALPPHLQAAGHRVRTALAAKPLDPPARKHLAPDTAAQQALRFLIQDGEAVELSADLVLGFAAFAQARDTIGRVLQKQSRATASELRQTLGTSRRVLIPLLEYLDRQGFTRRDGDYRSLR